MKAKKPVLAVVLDGFGIREEAEGNPTKVAKMPFWKKLLQTYPHTQIYASEEYVGLPVGQMGGSEVGHMNLGAGKCLLQEFMKINQAIKDKTFFSNPVLTAQMQRAVKNNSTLHLVGLVSDGGIHSSLYHLISLLEMAKQQKVQSVMVHCITDGRDSARNSGQDFLARLQSEIDRIGVGKIVTICGRFYAMDREKRWNRTERALGLIAFGKGTKVQNWQKVFDVEYAKKTSDEFIPLYVVGDYTGVKAKDEMFFFNFRPDRMRQITKAFSERSFKEFKRVLPKMNFASLTRYDVRDKNIQPAFVATYPSVTLSKYLSLLKYKQLKVSETTKYAHITYYFNGGVEKAPKGEQRILIESENVENFALYPQMKANEIATAVERAIVKREFDFILVNLSNPDMIGHTGDFKAAVLALEAVDKALEKMVVAGLNLGYSCIVTADHGNVEDMREKAPTLTTHTCNPVPFLITDKGIKFKKGKFGLSSFAPTVLDIMNLDKPMEMTAESLIK